MINHGMKTQRSAYILIITTLLFYVTVTGCSGTTHSSAQITLFEIPFGHSGKSSNNKTVRTNANTNYLPKKLGSFGHSRGIQNEDAAGGQVEPDEAVASYNNLLEFDRHAPRKPRPLGRSQGELYKIKSLPGSPALQGGESFTLELRTKS
jgi:hypothetical protein